MFLPTCTKTIGFIYFLVASVQIIKHVFDYTELPKGICIHIKIWNPPNQSAVNTMCRDCWILTIE